LSALAVREFFTDLGPRRVMLGTFMRIHRAWELPVLVMAPWRRLSLLVDSLGTSPR
jgi:hypothetical protein